MSSEPSWHLWRSFLAAIRHGSLSGAARALRLTQPTLGRHVEELEAVLGHALFARSQGGLVATPIAATFLPLAEAMESAASALMRRAESGHDRDHVEGTVRITASEVMGAEVLPPLLAGLRERHPGITLELVLTNRTENLLRRDADVAVRMVRPGQDALRARRLGEVELRFYAHRSYADRAGLPDALDQLPNFDLVGFDRDERSARAVAEGKLPIDRTLFTFRSDSDLAQAAAVKAGLGIGIMQTRLAARHPDLVPVLHEAMRLSLEVWLAMHEDQSTSLPVRLTFEALAEGLTEWLRTDPT